MHRPFWVLILPLFGCSDAASTPPVTVWHDSAGVTIAQNSRHDVELDWGVELLWSAGGVEDESLNLTRLESGQVAIKDGTLFIVDRTAQQVIVVSAEGVVGRIGRPGEGPGEFMDPVAIDFRDGELIVFDRGDGGIAVWDSSGALVDEIHTGEQMWGRRIRADRSSHTFVSLQKVGEGTVPTLLNLNEDTSVVLATDAPLASAPGNYPSCPRFQVSAPPLFAPRLVWDARDSRIAFAANPQYRIEVWREGSVRLSVRRDIAPDALTAAAAAREFGQDLDIPALGCHISAEEVVHVRGYSETLPLVSEITFGPSGEIWVRRNHVGTMSDATDVFDVDGTYIGTLGPDVPFPVMITESNLLVSLAVDSLDVPVVHVYEVSR